MKKKLIVFGILFLLILGILLILSHQKMEKEYTEHLFYMDTNIYIKIYSDDKKKAKDALREVSALYEKYHQLSDRYTHYNGITNIYDILHTSSKEDYLKIDSELYDMISYGLEWLDKSNGLLDIRIGNVIDVWKLYWDIGSGVPSYEELSIANANMVKNIELKDGNYILNNHPNIYLEGVNKGYATERVGEYLESIGITKYIINAGGNVKVGEHYNHSSYSIGIENPDSTVGDIYKVIYGNNISVVTIGGYHSYYEYNEIKYYHFINPSTLFPSGDSKSVTVVTDDSALGEVLSNILFLLPIEDGKNMINHMDGVEAIWYTNANEIVYTDGFLKYEK